jgi:hypothetical protein
MANSIESPVMIITALVLILLFVIIFMVVIIYYINKAIKSFSQSMKNEYDGYKNELKLQNDTLIKQLVDNKKQGEYDNEVKPKFERDLFSTFLKLREAIKENCIDTMNDIGCVRIAIYLLHNGSFSTHGISFFKMSCICEKIAIGSGVRERMIDHTNIPINLFDEMIDKLITNDRYIVMNNEDIQNTNHKIFLSADKIKYTQLVAIYDINNNLLGFVAAEMTHAYSKDLADKEKESLNKLVKQLVPVLSYSEYTTMKTQ